MPTKLSSDLYPAKFLHLSQQNRSFRIGKQNTGV